MAQMPPPPLGFAPPGQGYDPLPVQFDIPRGYHSDDHFGGDHGPQRNNNGKKNKSDKNAKKNAVEVQYEGFMLEKAAAAQVGDKPSWSRAGRRPLPFSDEKLAAICQKVRQEYRVGPLYTLARCTADQQGIISQLIQQRERDENNKDAEWVLECVRKYYQKHYWTRTKEVVRIMVILKRQDRNGTKSTQRLSSGGGVKGGNHFQESEIIDIRVPMKEGKKGKEKKGKDHDNDPWDDVPVGNVVPDHFADVGHGPHHNTPIVEVPPPPGFGHNQQPHHPQGHHQHPPQGAIPIDQWPPPPGMPQHGPMPYDNNPFQPNPQFNVPGAFEMPDPQRLNHFQTRARTPGGGRDSRSRSREEERRREERERRRFEQLEDRIDDRLDEVIDKVDNWNLRDGGHSSDESYRDDVWSSPSRGSFTPPSTPPLSAVMMDGGRRGSKHYRRDSGYLGGHRRSAGNVVLEPYNNQPQRRIEGVGVGRRRREATRYPNAPSPPRRRPLLHHSNTFSGRQDDYPQGPYAAPLRRSITQYPNEEYGVADFNRGGGRRREREREREGGRYYEERRGGRRGYVY